MLSAFDAECAPTIIITSTVFLSPFFYRYTCQCITHSRATCHPPQLHLSITRRPVPYPHTMEAANTNTEDTKQTCPPIPHPPSPPVEAASGVDKRLATSAWGVHGRAPFLPVFACVGQRPIHFLAARLPPGTLVPPSLPPPLKDCASDVGKEYLAKLDDRLPRWKQQRGVGGRGFAVYRFWFGGGWVDVPPGREVAELAPAVISWVAHMDSCLPLTVRHLAAERILFFIFSFFFHIC